MTSCTDTYGISNKYRLQPTSGLSSQSGQLRTPESKEMTDIYMGSSCLPLSGLMVYGCFVEVLSSHSVQQYQRT